MCHEFPDFVFSELSTHPHKRAVENDIQCSYWELKFILLHVSKNTGCQLNQVQVINIQKLAFLFGAFDEVTIFLECQNGTT